MTIVCNEDSSSGTTAVNQDCDLGGVCIPAVLDELQHGKCRVLELLNPKRQNYLGGHPEVIDHWFSRRWHSVTVYPKAYRTKLTISGLPLMGPLT